MKSSMAAILVAALAAGTGLAAEVTDVQNFANDVFMSKLMPREIAPFPGQSTVRISYVPVAVNALGTSSVTGVTCLEYGDGLKHKTVFDLSGATVTITNSGLATNGYGSVKLYDFPKGAIVVEGAKIAVAFDAIQALPAFTGLLAGCSGVANVGTSSQDDGGVVAAMANIATNAAIAGFTNTAAAQCVGPGSGAVLDGTTTARDAYLNFRFGASQISGVDSLSCTGKVEIWWYNLGAY